MSKLNFAEAGDAIPIVRQQAKADKTKILWNACGGDMNALTNAKPYSHDVMGSHRRLAFRGSVMIIPSCSLARPGELLVRIWVQHVYYIE